MNHHTTESINAVFHSAVPPKKLASSKIKARLDLLRGELFTGLTRGEAFTRELGNIARSNRRLNLWRFPSFLARVGLGLAAFIAFMIVARDGWNWLLKPMTGYHMTLIHAMGLMIFLRALAIGLPNRERLRKNSEEQKRVKELPWWDYHKERYELHFIGLIAMAAVWGVLWFIAS